VGDVSRKALAFVTPHASDFLEEMLGAHVIVPGQIPKSTEQYEPSSRLMAALIFGAACDLRSGHARLTNLARRWFQGARCTMPFTSACELLGLDADLIRKKIGTMQAPQIRGRKRVRARWRTWRLSRES
jgi:hypothetical protein